jgi:PAS domain S-box-containing protein
MQRLIARLLNTYSGKIVLLALLYIVTGKIGLSLAASSGYATIIWPPSGIAIGMLIIHGWRLWPGVFIGSFLLEFYLSRGSLWADGSAGPQVFLAIVIAAGSTIQALAGLLLIKRFLGLPLSFHHFRQAALLFVLAGPVACMTSATTGTSGLYFSSLLSFDKVPLNWITWWTGDVLGVIVFLPLILVAPGSEKGFKWRGTAIGTLPALGMLALIIPLALTLYAWKVSSENINRRSLSDFETLSVESQKALLYKINSYNNASLGAAGFFQSSQSVTRDEWRSYIETIDIRKSFPGINGIGYVANVQPDEVGQYLQEIRADNAPDFRIYPDTTDRPYYVITYIEPAAENRQAIGLNIGFEDSRMKAANLSRDTGNPAITNHIILVQDEEKQPGFLLLQPMYKAGMPTNTPEERRAALRGWIYVPFVAKNFLRDLTRSQGKTLNIRIYDGTEENPDTLIYNSNDSLNSAHVPRFTVRKELDVMQKKWLVVWESTLAYEQATNREGPLFILVGGLLFTGIFGVFIIVLSVRNTESLQWMTEKHKFILPLLIFIFFGTNSYYLHNVLKNREFKYLQSDIEADSRKIEQLITFQTSNKLLALKRMAQRWISAEGTPYEQWKDDADNYINQLEGLRTIEWVDSTYRIRWIEPQKGNEKALNLDIAFDDVRKQALQGAAQKESFTITPPIDLVQGYNAFIAYAPLKVRGQFDGFIAAIFATNEFLGSILTKELADNYIVHFFYEGRKFFSSEAEHAVLPAAWSVEKKINIHDKIWVIRITPKPAFIESNLSSLPFTIFIAGLLIATLLSLTVRYILISRIKSTYLRNTEETFRSAMEYASIGMALLDLDGKWLRVNPSLCKIIGYSEDELLKINFKTLTHPDDLKTDKEDVQKILRDEIQSYQVEKRYFHKDGHIIWGKLSVSLARKTDGSAKCFIAQIEDISERREMDRMKNEFVSIVSHELRTPLTSIRGSLGFIEGTMSQEIPDKARHLIGIAYKNCERLILLINDILDLDKMTAGKMHFEMKKENVENLVRNGIEANASYAEKFKVSFVSEQLDPSWTVNVDASRWHQAFTNLLSNAAKFSPEGSEIRISVTCENNWIRVSVRDQGPGIPEEFRSRIFSKFSQADSALTRSKGGTGLGLNISKEIVTGMGGKIGFHSQTGEGATFWFEFPIIDPVSEAEADNEKRISYTSGLPRILHVEHNTDFSKLLALALQDKAQLITAVTLRDAKDLIEKQEFSLILLDIGMPDGSGLSFIDYLHEKSYPPPPVIILSASEMAQDVLEKVTAAIVKSRVSENKIIETILSYLPEKGDDIT